jgi:hypothetical protein
MLSITAKLNYLSASRWRACQHRLHHQHLAQGSEAEGKQNARASAKQNLFFIKTEVTKAANKQINK